MKTKTFILLPLLFLVLTFSSGCMTRYLDVRTEVSESHPTPNGGWVSYYRTEGYHYDSGYREGYYYYNGQNGWGYYAKPLPPPTTFILNAGSGTGGRVVVIEDDRYRPEHHEQHHEGYLRQQQSYDRGVNFAPPPQQTGTSNFHR